ncbi:MAG: kinE 2 [Sporomusa sp.]|nr:kinE 2 [Sporomusa sp.]
MTVHEFSFIATLSATFAVVCVYFFLFWLYRHPYIGLWAIFWMVHFVSQFFYLTPLSQIPSPTLIGIQFISIINYILLVFATHRFLGQKMHKGWYYCGIVVTVLFSIAVFFEAPIIVKALPTLIYIAYIYFWHGWMFMRCLDSQSWGKTVVGAAFIASGIHTLDMPFLISVEWFVPWGFLISGTLRFIISIGTLMLYVEKNFRDLVAKETQYRLLAENAADTIYLYRLRPAHGFDYVSPSIHKLTGYRPEEYYESPGLLFSLIHPSDTFLIENLVSNPASFSTTPVVMRLIRRVHTIIWVEQTTVPLIDENGLYISFEGIIRDISARKTLEQDVSRLDRLNTVGQMAANVAHEIRNPLTTVSGYLQFFQKKSEFSSYKDHFNLLISELDRANLIIKEYLSLCQNKSRDMGFHQLNSIVQDIYPLIKAAANATSMDVHFIPGPIPEIHLDEKEIRQLLLNLVRNGLEAMKPGGTVTIRTYMRNGDVFLETQDYGTGIPPHILENIGKPFLTTKESGTGLGLAVVYRIANDHQATIQVESGPKGTTFNVIFKAK